MLTKAEADKLWAEVNHRRLDACPGPHDFTPITGGPGGMPRRYSCGRCGGVIDATHFHWYSRGLKHGRLSPAPLLELG